MRTLCVLLLTTAVATGSDSVLLEFSQPGCPACQQVKPAIAQIQRDGVAVRHIDVARERHLAQRYRVTSTPTFIVLNGGRELSRLEGAQSISQLRLALSNQQPSRLRATGARNSAPEVPQTKMATVSPNQSFNRSPAVRAEVMPTISLASAIERAQAATVRIRVREQGSVGVATGTVIDNHGEEALILTCGHVFRDSKGQAPIEVDLYIQGRVVRVPGQLVDYDADTKDIGLVSIKPGFPIQAVPIVPASDLPTSGVAAFSFGCDQGADPTRRDTRVTAVNKYNQHIGASNLEIAGAPTIGRSGGGLFDQQGRVIGVCNAADFEDNIGIYAGPGTIHWQLDRVALSKLYQAPKQRSIAPAPSAPPAPANTSQLGRLASNTPLPAAAINGIGGDKEVIIIMRDRNRPDANPQIKTFDRAPAEIVNLLR